MRLNLEGKHAIVTGASYGLGYAAAEALALEGVDVVICARDKMKIESAAQAIAVSTGSKVFGMSADLTKENDLKALVEKSKSLLGEIDVLVVSTGHPPTLPFSEATDKDWNVGTELVLRPPIVLARLVLEQMRKRKYGRIIFVGSIFGLEPEKSSVIQSTLRTGLNALAKCIATEVAPYGVTVNVVCPGYFETPLVYGLAKAQAGKQGGTSEDVLNEWRDYSPAKIFGKPEDFGALIAFIASPRAEFITGTTITIDGGAVRQY